MQLIKFLFIIFTFRVTVSFPNPYFVDSSSLAHELATFALKYFLFSSCGVHIYFLNSEMK